MGRNKIVDRETARLNALSAFWTHGYSGLSVRQLESLTGLNRFALQTEYGGKDGLFLDLAELYVSEWAKGEGKRIREGDLDALAAFFMKRTRRDLPQEFNSGCMLFNTLGGDQPKDDAIRDKVSSFLDTVKDCFATALKNEQLQGSLAEHVDIEQASQMLLTAIVGMNLLIKQSGDNAAARDTAHALKRTILSWRVEAKRDAQPA